MVKRALWHADTDQDAPSSHLAPSRSLLSRALALSSRFIPDEVRDQAPVRLLRARFVVLASLTVVVAAWVFAGLFTALGAAGIEATVPIVAIGSLCLVFPFMVRAGLPLGWVSHAFIATTQLGLLASISADGGLADPGVMWLAITPLIAAFAGGSALAWRAAASVWVLVLGLFVLGRLGVAFPEGAFSARPGADMIVAINALGCTGFAALLASLYEGPMMRHFQHLSRGLARANSDLRHELAERERAQRVAEAANRAKDVLLANMSHEFRTPLTSILGFTELLAHEGHPDHQSSLSAIDRGATRLLGTLDDVLDLAWAESDPGVLDAQACDVTHAARDVADALQPVAELRGLALSVCGSPAVAHVAPEALHRVLHALVDNAVRFTELGGVTVAVDADAEHVWLRVSDTGPGMREEAQRVAFEPFRQLSEGEARTHEGAGLGLAVAKRLVESMDGEIRLASVPGAGTTVTVRLPAGDGALAPPAEGAPMVAV